MFSYVLGHSRVMRVIKYFSIETGFCLQGATLLSVVPLHYTGLEKKIVDSGCPFVDKTSGVWESAWRSASASYLSLSLSRARVFAIITIRHSKLLDDHLKFRQ
jgi:hypothetical protein